MKCSRCLAICMDTDPFCFTCRAPLGGKRDNVLPGAENGKPPYAQRVATIFMCVGACVGPLIGKSLVLVDPSASGGIDWNQVTWAGIGGGTGGTLGYALGMLMFGTGTD